MKPASYALFCPSCGADGQSANAYCKRCGEWLPNIKARARRAFGGETPQQNIKLRRRLKRAREKLAQAPELGATRSTPALDAADMTEFVSTPGVTEGTTELLEPA